LIAGLATLPGTLVAQITQFLTIARLAGLMPLFFAGATLQKPRRIRLQILAELLEIASNGGATKTALVYKANLNFKLAQRYLDELEDKGMIVRREEGLGTTYVSTERGREALRNISQALDFMSEAQSFQSDAPVQAF